jgi:membrane protease YdiL (CAAX protease family)
MAKEAGEIVRYEPAPEPLAAAIGIAALTFITMVFVALFVAGLILGWNSPQEQQFLGFLLASAMTSTAFMLAIYRRWFLPDLLVVKKRRNKFEDL